MNPKILTLAFILILTGCATANSTQTTNNTQAIVKKTIDNKNITKRKELANLFLDSFATKEFLQSTIDSNPNESKELLTCIGSDSTLIEANKKVKAIFLENIEGLYF